MSKKFKLIHRETGELFRNTDDKYVVLYDIGFPAFVEGDQYYQWVTPVDMKVWKLVLSKNWLEKMLERLNNVQ